MCFKKNKDINEINNIKLVKKKNEIIGKKENNKNRINKDKIYIRHPLTYIMEAADDISYLASDLEDTINEGILERNDIIEYFKILDFKFYDNEYKIDEDFESATKCKCNENEHSEEKHLEHIEKYLNKEFSICEKHSSFSKLKTYLIRFLLKNCIDNFISSIKNKDINKYLNINKNEEGLIDQVDYLNRVPEVFLFYSMLKYKNDGEFGNFLYFDFKNSKKDEQEKNDEQEKKIGNESRIKKFKKEMNKKIFNSSRILNANTLASYVVSKLINILVPSTYGEEDILKISAFLPISFRKELIEEFKKSESKAEDVILDYIASLNDKEAQDLLEKLEEESFFKFGKLNDA